MTFALNPLVVASQWLSQFSAALHDGDTKAFVDLFLSDGWLRDILVFTWDIRALEGREKISTYVTNRLSVPQITNVQLDEAHDLAPHTCEIPVSRTLGVEFAFTFETMYGHGRGHIRLARGADDAYRAFTVFTELVDIRGHEELKSLPPRDDAGVRRSEASPNVIIGELRGVTAVVLFAD